MNHCRPQCLVSALSLRRPLSGCPHLPTSAPHAPAALGRLRALQAPVPGAALRVLPRPRAPHQRRGGRRWSPRGGAPPLGPAAARPLLASLSGPGPPRPLRTGAAHESPPAVSYASARPGPRGLPDFSARAGPCSPRSPCLFGRTQRQAWRPRRRPARW